MMPRPVDARQLHSLYFTARVSYFNLSELPVTSSLRAHSLFSNVDPSNHKETSTSNQISSLIEANEAKDSA